MIDPTKLREARDQLRKDVIFEYVALVQLMYETGATRHPDVEKNKAALDIKVLKLETYDEILALEPAKPTAMVLPFPPMLPRKSSAEMAADSKAEADALAKDGGFLDLSQTRTILDEQPA